MSLSPFNNFLRDSVSYYLYQSYFHDRENTNNDYLVIIKIISFLKANKTSPLGISPSRAFWVYITLLRPSEISKQYLFVVFIFAPNLRPLFLHSL